MKEKRKKDASGLILGRVSMDRVLTLFGQHKMGSPVRLR